ncbi:uncharacterized protein LOC128883446 [Hylaeus volcanicus]|uniref:uncharacterized protein LOC128883446 n=1 Tax=Hylaeus volcanicus TaxID=313075 RepID=UPI0023B85E64|nr:uncharacterized protein LOC128883446 [Hylaeus volcanicus]XP_053991782.1 uncharacterized protein LOC128883446 [Hylaeus volcanicus]
MTSTNLEFAFFYKQSILHIFNAKNLNTFEKNQRSSDDSIQTTSRVYRHVNDSLFYNETFNVAVHSKSVQNSVEKQWNDVSASYHPNFSCYTRRDVDAALNYLQRILKLPHRLWNQEWASCRKKIITLECSIQKKLRKIYPLNTCSYSVSSTESKTQYCHPKCICSVNNPFSFNQRRRIDRLISKLVNYYKKIIWIQQHFLYISTAVFLTLTHSETRNLLGDYLSEYYVYHLNQKNPSKKMKQLFQCMDCLKTPRYAAFFYEKQSRSLRKTFFEFNETKVPEQTGPHNIVTFRPHGKQLANHLKARSALMDSSSNAFHWTDHGFEFQGIWFKSVKDVPLWKTVKREIVLTNAIFFDKEYPYAPLLVCFADCHYQFVASALRIDKKAHEEIPPQLSLKFSKQLIHHLNCMVAKKLILPNMKTTMKRIISGLKNPDLLLTMYSPCYLPINTHSCPANAKIIIALSLEALTNALIFLNDDTTETSISNFEHYMYLMLIILYGKKISLEKLLFTENKMLKNENEEEMKPLNYIEQNPLVSISKSSILSFTQPKSCDNAVQWYNKLFHCPLYALGFLKEDGHKLLHILTDYDRHFLLKLCSQYFQCDPHYVLPFDPIEESQTDFVYLNTPWKTKLLGYPCSVWISTQSSEKSQNFHSLLVPLKKNRKNKKNQFFFRFPWNTNDFVLILGQIPFYERAETYIHKSTRRKKKYTLQQVFHLLEIHCIASSTALHDIIHYCQRSVKKTLWELWISSQTMGAMSHSVLQVIACDLVASSARLVFQYYSTTFSCLTSNTAEENHLLQIFFFLFFGLKTRSHTLLDDENIRTVEQLLHIALWCSLLNVKYMIHGPLDSLIILNVYKKAKENPECLLNMLFEQLHLNKETLSVLYRLPWEKSCKSFTNQLFYPIKGWETYGGDKLIHFLVKGSDEEMPCTTTNIALSESALLNFSAIMSSPSYFKITFTLRPQTILLHLLTFLCFQRTNSCFCIDTLYAVLGHRADFSTVVVPLDDDLFHYLITQNNVKPSQLFLSTLQMIENQMNSFYLYENMVESVLVVLFHLLFSQVNVLPCNATNVLPSGFSIQRICLFLQRQEELLTNPYIKGYILLLQGLAGLAYLSKESEEKSLMDFFFKAIHCFITTCGNPSCVFYNGWSVLLYPCWILAHYLRLKEANTEALMYETIFRMSRALTHECSLSYTFPRVASIQSNTSLLSLLRSQHECFISNKTIPWLCSLYTYHATTPYYATDFCLTGKMTTFVSPVLSFGSNMSGCLGLGYPTQTQDVSFCSKREKYQKNEDIWWTLQPTPVIQLKKSVILSVSSGGHHCLALTHDGRLWSWGCNFFGELGCSPKETASKESYERLDHWNWFCNPYDTCEEVYSTAFLKEKKKTFNNTTLTETVLPFVNPLTLKGQEKGCTNIHEHLPDVVLAEPTPLLSFQPCIQSITCGYNYSSAITFEGTLFMWGCNSMGQLGLGDCHDREIPTQVTHFLVPVISISCGYSHTAVITKTNSLWCWGSNTYGQVGYPFCSDRSNLDTVATIPNYCTLPVELCILQIYSENEMHGIKKTCSQEITMEHEYQIWRQDKTQSKYCIINNTFNCVYPKTNQVQFLSVTCGNTHTLAIDLENTVWSWGSNFFGELGQQDSHHSSIFNIIETSPFLHNLRQYETNQNIRVSPCCLSKNSFFSQKRIHHVFAGRFTSSAIDENATAWFWGTNLFNNLSIDRNDLLQSFSPIQSPLFKNKSIDTIVYDWNGTHQAIITSTHDYALWGEEDGLLIRNHSLKNKKKIVWSFPTQTNKNPKSLESLKKIFILLSQKKKEDKNCYHEILPVMLPKIKSTFSLTKIALGLHHALFCLHTSLPKEDHTD